MFGDLYKKFHGNFWVALEPHLRAIAIAAAMTFVEIQKIFEQLFVTLPGKFKSA